MCCEIVACHKRSVEGRTLNQMLGVGIMFSVLLVGRPGIATADFTSVCPGSIPSYSQLQIVQWATNYTVNQTLTSFSQEFLCWSMSYIYIEVFRGIMYYIKL